jgi:hypothetical protein
MVSLLLKCLKSAHDDSKGNGRGLALKKGDRLAAPEATFTLRMSVDARELLESAPVAGLEFA